jgi:hypothetical protein
MRSFPEANSRTQRMSIKKTICLNKPCQVSGNVRLPEPHRNVQGIFVCPSTR